MNPEAPTAEVRRRVSAGLLPKATHFRAFAGRSRGATCDACGQQILRSAVQYDIDLLDDSELVSSTVTMHPDCHVLWLELSRVSASIAGAGKFGELR